MSVDHKFGNHKMAQFIQYCDYSQQDVSPVVWITDDILVCTYAAPFTHNH